MGNENVIVRSCSCFLLDGGFVEYVFEGDKKMIQLKSLDKDTYEDVQWRYSANDSLLELGNLKIKVLSYNNETITMRDERQQIQKLVRRQ